MSDRTAPHSRAAAPSQTLTEHPGLRLRIYHINPRTLARTSAVEIQARPSKAPMMSTAFPPCECLRCEKLRGGRR